MHTLPSSSSSEFCSLQSNPNKKLTTPHRQHPAVISQPDKIFVFIAQALEAETLQGQIATTVVEAAKMLLSVTGRDPGQLMSQLNPDTQKTIRAYFS